MDITENYIVIRQYEEGIGEGETRNVVTQFRRAEKVEQNRVINSINRIL
jgi:hypothetical protein